MKKLTLHVDALRVESFATGTGLRGGTVRARQDSWDPCTLEGFTCEPDTRAPSCGTYTCDTEMGVCPFTYHLTCLCPNTGDRCPPSEIMDCV